MQQVVSPITVYTVIGYITNAILTFEPLQIRSNLSGGPQLMSCNKNCENRKTRPQRHAQNLNMSYWLFNRFCFFWCQIREKEAKKSVCIFFHSGWLTEEIRFLKILQI